MPIDVSGFMPDNSQNPALYKMADTLERHGQNKREMNWRLQRQQEADEWKRLALIRGFTNIDDHHSGEGAMDALGDKKMADLITEFTLGGYSPNEIQAKLPQRVHQTISALDAAKNEYAQSDKIINEISKLYPGFLDTQSMREAHRKEILGRRLNPNGDFVNPSDVKPSKFDFSNPETLADFIPQDSDKVISQEISDPKLYQTEHRAKGNRDSYIKFTEKLSPFAKSNITPDSYNADMFLKNNVSPKILFDSLPEDLFGQKIETLSPEAYKKGFSQKANIAFLAMAKRGMPQWSKMTAEEKDKSIRHLALGYVQKLDKSGYSFDNANPPAARTTNNINTGTGSNINDVYRRIGDKIEGDLSKGVTGTRYNSLSNDEQAVVKSAVENAGYDIGQGGRNVFLYKSDDGKIKVYALTGDGRMVISEDKEIATLSFVGTNISRQPGVAEKREVTRIGEGNKKEETKVDLKSLDPNGFKKEGKYWKYKDGRLFDDNGNLIKQ